MTDMKASGCDILVIDDEIYYLQLLNQLLSKEGYVVRTVESPRLAIDSALAQIPSLILLDVRMPDIDGFEVCRRLKREKRTRDVPIIFICALQDTQGRIRAFEAGGVDFISKPLQMPEVMARVRTHLTLRNMQLHLNELVAERTTELTVSNKLLAAETREMSRQCSLNYAILNSLDSHLAAIDQDGEIIAVNNSWNEFGTANNALSVEKIAIGVNYLDAILSETSDEVLRAIEGIRSVLDGRLARFDMEYPCLSLSEKKWFSIAVMPMRTEEGGAVVTHTDITERKKMEEVLAKSEAHYRALIDNSLVGAFNINLSGEFLYVNAAMAQMFDFDSTELMLEEGSLSRWMDLQQREKMLAELQQHNNVSTLEANLITHSGRHIDVLLSAKLLENVISGIVMDITATKLVKKKHCKSVSNGSTPLLSWRPSVLPTFRQRGKFCVSTRSTATSLAIRSRTP